MSIEHRIHADRGAKDEPLEATIAEEISVLLDSADSDFGSGTFTDVTLLNPGGLAGPGVLLTTATGDEYMVNVRPR